MKKQHGGRRPRAGRKPVGDAPKITTSVSLPREIVDYLRSTGMSRGEAVEQAVRESAGYRQWANRPPKSD